MRLAAENEILLMKLLERIAEGLERLCDEVEAINDQPFWKGRIVVRGGGSD